MNCKNCGNVLVPGEMFCRNCGTRIETNNPMNSNMMNNEPMHTETPVMQSSPINSAPLENNEPVRIERPVMTNNLNSTPVMNNEAVHPASPMMPNNPINSMPVNNSGPMMNNMPSNYPTQNNSKKGLLIVGGLILVALIVLIVLLLNPGDKKNNNTGSDSEDKTVAKVSTFSVGFKGYKLSIPTEYSVEESGNKLFVYDRAETWALIIEIFDGKINLNNSTLTATKANLIRGGYTVANSDIKKISDVDYMIYELSKGGYNTILGIGKLDANTVFGVEVYNSLSNGFDYSLISKFSDIIKTATKSAVSNSMSLKDNMSFVDIIGTEEETE